MRLAHEHHKGRLEGVLGVLRVIQDPLARAQHHGPMPLHQGFKRHLVVVPDIPLQELPVGLTLGRQGEKVAGGRVGSGERLGCHSLSSPEGCVILPHRYCPGAAPPNEQILQKARAKSSHRRHLDGHLGGVVAALGVGGGARPPATSTAPKWIALHPSTHTPPPKRSPKWIALHAPGVSWFQVILSQKLVAERRLHVITSESTNGQPTP